MEAWEPPLNAKNPKMSMKAPRLTRGMEWATISAWPYRENHLKLMVLTHYEDKTFSVNLPILGPSMIAPTRATTPPER